MGKTKGTKVLARKAWKLMSKYVRLSEEEDGCFTCGKVRPWKEMHAGHYKHAADTNLVSYDERNIKNQCPSCNSFGHGKLDVYAERLVEMYGSEVLSELTLIKNTTIKGAEKVEFLEGKIMELELKIKEV